MPKTSSIDDAVVLTAALEGLALQRQKLDEQIRAVRAGLDKLGGRRSVKRAAKPKKKRVLSAAARKRIAQAQKKRWAEYRKKADKA